MFSLGDLKQTRFYQDTFADGEIIGAKRGEKKAKQKAVSRMLKLGLSLEVIAESLDLPLSDIQKIGDSANNNYITEDI